VRKRAKAKGIGFMLMILQVGAQAEATQKDIQIAQEVVIAIIAASTIVVLGLLLLMGHFARKRPPTKGRYTTEIPS
jgi:hypothetical protein